MKPTHDSPESWVLNLVIESVAGHGGNLWRWVGLVTRSWEWNPRFLMHELLGVHFTTSFRRAVI